MTIRVLAAVLLLVLAACHDQRSPVGVVHVAGARARPRDVDARFRLAVGGLKRPPVSVGKGVVPPDGRVRVVLEAGGPASPSADAVVLVDGRVSLLAATVEADGGARVATIPFGPRDAGRVAQWAVKARAELPVAWSFRTRAVRVWPGSRLRAALVLNPETCAQQGATLIALDALADGARVPLLRRRLVPPDGCARWQAVEVALPAARRARLVARARLASASTTPRHVDALVGDWTIVPPAPPPARAAASPPNVILISLDTLGAEHLGTYGYPEPTSPGLDAFAARSVTFEDAVAHYPSTAASHMTMLTGVLPARHGVRGVVDALPPTIPTLAELLGAAGWRTAGFTEDATLNASMGFARGFDVYRENRSGAYGTAGEARQTLRWARRWLRSADAHEPFFLFVHTYQVHSPYDPPDAFARLVRRRRPPTSPRDPRWLYDGEVRFLDAVVRRFLDGIRAAGLEDRTIVVVTADHGESFGEHGHVGHGTCLHEEVMHVPLVVHAPGVAPRRIAQRVGLVDLVPTLLELVGVAPPRELHGRSLAPLLRGGTLPDRPLVAELRGALGPDPAHPEQNLRAVWFGAEKLTHDVHQHRWILSFPGEDPLERRELLVSPGVEPDAEAVLAWYETLAPPKVAATALPSRESIERLRALGYVQ